MAFIDTISEFFARLKAKDSISGIFSGLGKNKDNKSTPNTEMALEILMLVQEAMDHKDDPDKLTATLGRIQQVANHALGESTPLLTGPKNSETVLENGELHVDHIGQRTKDNLNFDEHIEVAETEISSSDKIPFEPDSKKESDAQVEQTVSPEVVSQAEETDIIEAEPQLEEKADESAEVTTDNTVEREKAEIDAVSPKNENQVEKEITKDAEVKIQDEVEVQPEAVSTSEFAADAQDEIKTQPDPEMVTDIPEALETTVKVSEEIETSSETDVTPEVEKVSDTETENTIDAEIQEKSESEAEVEPEPMDLDRFVGKRVLYAFGNAAEEGLIRSSCETWQITLDVVTSGLTAVKAFSASDPGTYDAIILEKSMPLMNGFMAAKCIRKDKHAESESVPIIVSAVGTPVGQTERESDNLSACLNEGTERELYDVLSKIWKKDDGE